MTLIAARTIAGLEWLSRGMTMSITTYASDILVLPWLLRWSRGAGGGRYADDSYFYYWFYRLSLKRYFVLASTLTTVVMVSVGALDDSTCVTSPLTFREAIYAMSVGWAINYNKYTWAHYEAFGKTRKRWSTSTLLGWTSDWVPYYITSHITAAALPTTIGCDWPNSLINSDRQLWS